MRQFIALFGLVLWAVSGVVAAEPSIKEGEHYKRLADPQPTDENTIEVVEFFSYACPHCAEFAPYIERWKEHAPDNVTVEYVPVVFRNSWVGMAKAYYAFEAMGVMDKAHHRLFEAIHEENKPVKTPEQIADIVAGAGIDKDKFLEAMDSFSVDSKVRQSIQRTQAHKISGVPSVAVNGKYLVGGGMVKSFDHMLKIIDHLVELESGKPAEAE